MRSLAQSGAAAGRRAGLRRGRDRRVAGAGGDRGRQARRAVGLPAAAAARPRLPDRLRLGGRARGRGAAAGARAPGASRAGGAAALGGAPGRAWERGRYDGPYLRDELLDLGYLAETLETAHTWSRLSDLYDEVRAALGTALAAQGTHALVMCHLSHAYPDGASLYFTFLARRRPGAELEQWRAAKTAASRGDRRGGGTITHHHGVGRDHAPLHAPPRWASSGSRPCGRSRSASTRRGS